MKRIALFFALASLAGCSGGADPSICVELAEPSHPPTMQDQTERAAHTCLRKAAYLAGKSGDVSDAAVEQALQSCQAETAAQETSINSDPDVSPENRRDLINTARETDRDLIKSYLTQAHRSACWKAK